MTLDVERVCPACRRFWHGPPGRLTANGPLCPNPDHRPAVGLEALADRDAERGSRRFEEMRKLGVPVVREDGSRYSPENDDQSFAAARFACQQLGVVHLETTDEVPDEGFDYVLDGLTYDVKWLGFESGTRPRPGPGAHVIVNPGKLKADRYVAVAGSIAEGFRLVGWAERAAFESRERKNFGYGPKHAVPVDELEPVTTLPTAHVWASR